MHYYHPCYNYRAATFFQQGKTAEAITALEQSLEISTNYGLRPQSALAMRLLGDALIQSSRAEEAFGSLETAQQNFIEMGMVMEHAACLASLGAYYESVSNTQLALTAFEASLQVSQGVFPEIDWRVHVELGKLAQTQADTDLALSNYRLGLDALKRIRRNFLQPSLAGSYFYTPASIFEHIVTFASNENAVQAALYFIEESKGSTLLRSLAGKEQHGHNFDSDILSDLRNEIEQLKSQMRVSPSEVHPLQSAIRMRQARDDLRRKTQDYDEMKSRLERKDLRTHNMETNASFDLDGFRQMASKILDDRWLALDYFASHDELIIVLVTPYEIEIYTHPVSPRFGMALNACDKARRTAAPLLQSDMEILGRMLIPVSVQKKLSPDTQLLLAPHRRLHQVPWAGIQAEFSNQPLVMDCIPSVIPSLQGLKLLWERNSRLEDVDRKTGLLVGISSFDHLYADIPLVRYELNTISSKLGSSGQVLMEKDASWQNLFELARETGLTRFAWLHVASHFFSDRHTGRLSGLALSDGDIFLDQIRDLAPLPGVVSLSACNSNDSFLFEGDERIDLQTTCFIAGANSVVGSSWPVLDESAAELTIRFFEHYLSGDSPSRSVAKTQRQSIKHRKSLESWASFVCAGEP